MSDNNVLVTGTPRSGTTLTCHLLNKLPDTVALHEPMKVKRFATIGGHDKISEEVARFCREQRAEIRRRGRARSKNVDGAVPDNPVGVARSASGLRQSIASIGWITIDKPLSPDFTLVVKHNSSFTAALGGLVERFPIFAVVRNPLATISSWSSVDFNVQSGHARAAERIDPGLTSMLAAVDDGLDRQIALLDWFHGQFRRYLPEQSVIRYESIVASGGKALRVVQPGAEELDEPLASRNASRLYDAPGVIRIAERLLRTDGAFWAFYTREEVERLVDEMVGSATP